MRNNSTKFLAVVTALLINACLFGVLDVAADGDGTDRNYPRISNSQVLEMEFIRNAPNDTDERIAVLPNDSRVESTISSISQQIGRLDLSSSELSEKLDLRKQSGLPLWVQLNGKEYAIQPLDVYDDTSQGVRHETLALVADELGIARFTITSSGDVVLVGTITVGNEHYRIVADGGPSGDLLVFSMFEQNDGNDHMSAEYGKIVSTSTDQKYLAYLEELHIESLLLAERQPLFTKRERGLQSASIQLVGGNLGKVDVHDISLETAPALLKRVLIDLNPTTGVDSTSQFEILDISGGATDGYIITFRQLLNGVPVESVNHMDIAPVSGEINRIDLSIFFYQPANPITIGAMNQVDAESYAIAAVQNHLQQLDENFSVEHSESELVYAVEGANKLTLQWIIKVEQYLVRVDAISGETMLQDLRMRAGASQLLTDTCRHTGTSTAPNPKCEDSNVARVYRETSPPVAGCGGEGEMQCVGGSFCNTRHQNVYRTIGQVEAEWAYGNPASCCSSAGINDNRIGVLLDSQSAAKAEAAYYLPGFTGQIHLPPTGIYNFNDPALDSSLIAHEATHAIQEALNPTLVNRPDTAMVLALEEGIASAFAFVVDKRNNYNTNPAIVAPLTAPLNISTSRGFRDIWFSPEANDYEDAIRLNASVVANFYYRVSIKSGVTQNDMSKLVIDSLRSLKRSVIVNGDFYLDDFKDAVLAASTGNSTLRSAVNSAYSAMETRVSQYPWGAAPPSSVWVDSTSSRCSNGVWRGTLRWNNTGADAYAVAFLKVLPPEAVLVEGTSLSFEVAIPAKLKVSSCVDAPNPFSTTGQTVLACGNMSTTYAQSPTFCL